MRRIVETIVCVWADMVQSLSEERSRSDERGERERGRDWLWHGDDPRAREAWRPVATEIA